MRDIIPQVALPSAFGYPTLATRVQDTDVAAGTQLTGTTCVGFVPYSIPPRARITKAWVGGGTTPASASTGSMQFQWFNMSSDYAPSTLLGTTTTVILAGTGNVVDTSAPPYVGHQAGANWWAPVTFDSVIQNLSYQSPLELFLGLQIQGGGAFSAGGWTVYTRNLNAPSILKIGSDQAWQYTFVASPTVAGQASGDLEGRPMVSLIFEAI